MAQTNPAEARRRRILTRALPIALCGLAAFVAGALAGRGSVNLGAAERFAAAWQAQDFPAMHRELTPQSAKRYPLRAFTADYRRAQTTATVTAVTPGEASEGGSGATAVVPVTLATNAFGPIAGRLELPLADGRVDWAPRLLFPGLASGERLVRRTRVPKRAPILARDGTPLAEGPATARFSPLGTAALNVAGEVSTPSRKQNRELEVLGFPAGSATGASGLELAFNRRLSGQPGGQLVATSGGAGGGRVLASREPEPGKALHTTIDPDLQRAAVAALGSTYGGLAVLDARTGSVRALAGIAFSAPQPPGSTFKLITTSAALDAGVVKLSDQFPIQTSTVVDGREVANAHGEACGGSFVQAFAESCNSVFVPLGPKVGSERLVDTAERYGFNSPPALYDAAAVKAVDAPKSSLPTSIPTDLDLGVTAIGQGRVLATPLEMAAVAQTIANRGTRSPNALVRDPGLGPDTGPTRVTSPGIAARIRSLMIAVVTQGTGTAAALPGLQVAGKTGTAELGPLDASSQPASAGAEQKVDAWFTAFAPASDPKLVAAAMVVNASADGGTVAAPIVRDVLAAGLGVG